LCDNAVCLQADSYSSPESRHAVLHDFCMIIPYSILVILAGLITIPFGAGGRGFILAAVGGVELGLSCISLTRFQAQQSSTPFTAGSAGLILGREGGGGEGCTSGVR